MSVRTAPRLPWFGRTPGAGTGTEGQPGPRAAALGPLIAGAVLLVAGGFLFAQSIAAVGDRGIALGEPTLAPVIVTGLWVVVAAVYLVGQLRTRVVAVADKPRWRTSFLLLALLVGYAVVLTYTVLGYLVTTTLFFFAAARVLSTRPLREVVVRDVSVAVGLPLVIYLVFTRLLDIALPAGVVPL